MQALLGTASQFCEVVVPQSRICPFSRVDKWVPPSCSIFVADKLCIVYRRSRLGPVDPACRALSGRLKLTVRRHKFNQDSLPPKALPSKLRLSEGHCRIDTALAFTQPESMVRLTSVSCIDYGKALHWLRLSTVNAAWRENEPWCNRAIARTLVAIKRTLVQSGDLDVGQLHWLR